MHYSHEQEATSYGKMVTYEGDADISKDTIAKMDEELVHQQPERKDATFGGL